MEINHHDGLAIKPDDSSSQLVPALQSSKDEAGDNLISLVHYLKHLQNTPCPNPEWAKFDTATTMSDNRGGVIKF